MHLALTEVVVRPGGGREEDARERQPDAASIQNLMSKLLVGGAIAALAVSYIVYRRQKMKKRRLRPTLILFDVDGTLAIPAQPASKQMIATLARLRDAGHLVGIVGAGDFEKQQGQLGGPGLRNGSAAACGTSNATTCAVGRASLLLHFRPMVLLDGARLRARRAAQWRGEDRLRRAVSGKRVPSQSHTA